MRIIFADSFSAKVKLWQQPCLRDVFLLSCHGRSVGLGFICKWLDFLVFSDKDDKLEVPSHNSLNVDNSVGRKRTHTLFEKSRVIPVLWLSFIHEWGGGVGEVGHLCMGP